VFSVATKIAWLFRWRAVMLLALSVAAAAFAARSGGGIGNMGFWDGPL
jgi:hypothetical protein